MGSSSYDSLNIAVCGINQANEELINRLFPTRINQNPRELKRKENGNDIYYTARIFRGQISQENTLNSIKDYINTEFDRILNSNYHSLLF